MIYLDRILKRRLTLDRWGTISSLTLVFMKGLIDLREVHEHG